MSFTISHNGKVQRTQIFEPTTTTVVSRINLSLWKLLTKPREAAPVDTAVGKNILPVRQKEQSHSNLKPIWMCNIVTKPDQHIIMAENGVCEISKAKTRREQSRNKIFRKIIFWLNVSTGVHRNYDRTSKTRQKWNLLCHSHIPHKHLNIL